jgi:hypothetical protein
MDWDTAKSHAVKFLPLLQQEWNHYIEEIRGKIALFLGLNKMLID